jgi:oxygen-independent coproporphyrinogen-3 oxidase
LGSIKQQIASSEAPPVVGKPAASKPVVGGVAKTPAVSTPAMGTPTKANPASIAPIGVAPLGLYAHIPFCTSKCPYCDFNSRAAPSLNKAEEDRYVEALTSELGSTLTQRPELQGRTLESLYFGGGTPSLLEPQSIGKIINAVTSEFLNQPDTPAEITLEVNPGSSNKAKLRGFKEAGINRLSIGVQSFDNATLCVLGRGHSVGDSIEIIKTARELGYDNIGIDLIFGAPAQSLETWKESVTEAIELQPEHISMYGLTIENNTPFYDKLNTGKLKIADEELSGAMYSEATERFTLAGYEHYEISNLSLRGFGSRHNQRYWRSGRHGNDPQNNGDYIGLGAGAHSYLTDFTGENHWGERSWNEPDIDQYIKLSNSGKSTRIGREVLTKNEAMTERLMLGLRCIKGIEVADFEREFGISPIEALSRKDLLSSKEAPLIEQKGGRLRLTKEGLLLFNEIY